MAQGVYSNFAIISHTSSEFVVDCAQMMPGVPKAIETTDRVACIVEYRDGTVIDVIREIKK